MLAESRSSMTTRPCNVLFLCAGNTARSVLAESILRQLGAGRFNAFSAGSQPKGVINKLALHVLAAMDYPTAGMRSKSWEEFATPDAPQMDVTITVCDDAAGESCPVWPGRPAAAHWGIEDPAAVTGGDIKKLRAFTEAFHQIKDRIAAFVALPIERLDPVALSVSLREIGRLHGATELAGGNKDD